MTNPTTPLISAPEFTSAMAQHVSSVCVVTTVFEGKRHGLTATAMCAVCATPPRLLVCVNKSGMSHEMLGKSGVFCVNVLSEHQDKIAKGFAGMLGKTYDRFSLGEWNELVTGAPVLAGTAAAFDCRLVQVIDQFSHSIMLGEVVAANTKAQDPLLYGGRKFRNLRKHMTETSGTTEELLID